MTIQKFPTTFAGMKNEILSVATDLFLNLGFKSVTMDEIAQKMGISKKTIYAHFKTKFILVEACALELYDGITEGIDEIIAEDYNPIEELLRIHNYILKRLREEKSSPQFQLKKYYPKIEDCIREKKKERMKECVIENLNRGVAQGLYRQEIPVVVIYRFYFMMLEGIKDSEFFPAEDYPTRILVQHFLEYHLRGIVSPKGLTLLENLAKKIES